MRNICWVQHGNEVDWAVQVADCLRERGYAVHFVCFMRQIHERYKARGHSSHFIGEVFGWPDLSADELEAIDRAYGPPGLPQIALSDVYMKLLFGNDERRKRQLIAKAFRWWEAFVDTHDLQYLVMRDTASFVTRTAYAIGRKRGRPKHAILNIGPVNGTMTIADEAEKLLWRELVDAAAKPLPPLDRTQRAQIDTLVQSRLDDVDRPATILPGFTPLQFIRFAVRNLRRRRRALPSGDPIDRAVAKLEFDKYLKCFVFRYLTSCRFPYDSIVDEERFVYFPLFFEGEWQNLVGTPFLARNLVAVLREIAYNLPLGYKLYVKEHPAVPGEFSMRRLQMIRRLPNVRVIEPRTSGQTLIKRCHAMICAMSTSGWEGVLLRKPVIVLGDTWYSACPTAFPLRSLDDIADVLRVALEEGPSRVAQQTENWYRYIGLVLRTSAEGSVYAYKLPFFDHHNLENSSKIAAFLARRMDDRLGIADETQPVALRGVAQ